MAVTTGEVQSAAGVSGIARVATEALKARRLESIDLLRGLVMIIMALDHTRDFLGDTTVNPRDLAHASAALFLTRWITNFCAPVFFLLTGTGAHLSLRHKTRSELSIFLLTRGAWLILLELTFFRCLGLQFNFDYQVTILNVLWALGCSMIVLSGLVWLSLRFILAIGVLLICAHNLLDPIDSSNPLWVILHSPGSLVDAPRFTVRVAYPLIPWIGVTAVGYGLGQIFAWEPARRRTFLLAAGLAVCALFVALRCTNLYGDPVAFRVQPSFAFTVLSFLNTSKYPPSLLFLLMTLGPALLLLSVADRGLPRFLQPAVTLGRVPMFFYLLHMPLIHLLAVLVCLARYSSIHWMFESPTISRFPFTPPPGWGLALPFIYLFWAAVVVAMYPLCRSFAALKQRHHWGWLSYA
jgi:uncharacterized membrane protein